MASINSIGPLSVDRYAGIDDEVDVEQCSDSEGKSTNTRRTTQTSLASPSVPSDDERLTPEQVPVIYHCAPIVHKSHAAISHYYTYETIVYHCWLIYNFRFNTFDHNLDKIPFD